MLIPTDITGRIQKNAQITVLTGAGISRESGIPTFRGEDGLWKTYRPEELANPEAFRRNPDLVWEWYQFRRTIVRKARPNAAHLAIAELEGLFPRLTLITQNVDGLHERAGSRRILELHGNIEKNICSHCGIRYDIQYPPEEKTAPVCSCGAAIRPDIVWFGEMLNPETLQKAQEAAVHSDLFLSIGTSSVVYPAAALPLAALQHGAALIEINPERTELSSYATAHFAGAAGDIMPVLLKKFRELLN